MTTDLVAWLREQLDEDERAVKRVPQPYRLYVSHDGCLSEPLRVDNPDDERFGEYEQWADGGDRLPNHHGTWELVFDPAAVLADIDAKRRIVDEYEAAIERAKRHPDDLPSAGAALTMVRVVKLLALRYAGRPGYRDEWRP